jgi:alkaline phosphatase
MKKAPLIFILFLAVVSLTTCRTVPGGSYQKPREIKNVILMIGDGMGLPHVSAAMTVSVTPLNISRCTVTGLQVTSSADNYITDSGAAGTAMASGTRTKNGAVGVDTDGNSVRSIIEIAEDHGLSTGLVSTSAITHATPAAFIAHRRSRVDYQGIAQDFLKTDIDVFIGGGYADFASRRDGVNLIDTLKARGYEVDTTMEMIMRSDADRLAGFTARHDNPYRLKGRGDMLPKATEKAIDILKKNEKGFFLMVEGSQIDWASHAHAGDTLVDETIDFDEAVGKALDFAAADGHTLVVVTGDHETGGLTIIGGDVKTHTVTLAFSTTGHTAVMVPVYAYGPGAGRFTGIYNNTEIFVKMRDALGLVTGK